jgi:alpha-L-arabinofuranosidase
MQLYAQHALPTPLQASTTFDGLDVFACASERRDALTVFVINSKPEAVNCSLDFEHFAEPVQTVSITSVSDQQAARQPDVVNHWGVPNRVRPKTESFIGKKVTVPPLSVNAISCR